MASPEAKRLRAKLFGSNPTQDDAVSALDSIESISAVREQERRANEGVKPPRGVSIKQREVAGLSCEWIHGSRGSSPKTTVLFLHGGGFVWGSSATYRGLAAYIAIASGAGVLVPDYRLAPEYPFPASVEDVTAVYEYFLRDGTNPGRLVIAGDSAGGGLCAALLLAIRDRGGPMPAGVVLISPWADLTFSGESHRTRAALDPIDRLPVLRRMAQLYLDGRDPTDPLASPVFGDLQGLPTTLILVGDHEVLLDDSRLFAERAKEKGVPVQMEVWPEMWHGWLMSAPELPEANEAIRSIAAFVRKVTSERD